MKEFWNERFSAEYYVYGTEPNVFFKQQLDSLSPGRLLLPAEGEGRNAVYAARQGWEVVAVDISEAGRDKALQLARQAGVRIEYHVGAFDEVDLPAASFDCVGLVYAHFPTDLRPALHAKAARMLKPGGTLILEGFSKEQMNYSSGGPRNEAMLFSLSELREDFSTLRFRQAEKTLVELREGPFHEGDASVIRLVAEQPVT